MRKIIHIDMDCFFAAVETRENPQLQGKPVTVGGRPESRGVVAACNYEARAYGIHSAMPMSQAIRRCPHLIMLGVNMNLYKSVSVKIQAIFKQYTSLVQPLSLDEAFLDVSDCKQHHGSATLIAQAIRQRIFAEHKLTASAGIAPNKFLAKIASDWNKPNGQFVITPNNIADFVIELPVKKIFGVGKMTNKKMQKLAIKTCYDLQQLSKEQLYQYFGKFGNQLYNLCRGIDNRPVNPDRIRKSLSIEDTFTHDKADLPACLATLPTLYNSMLSRLVKAQQKHKLPIKALFIKLRFNNFKTTTAQTIATKPAIFIYQQLVTTAWNRGKRPVRLIGLGVQFDIKDAVIQLDLPI
ncbi:DNA polymerase IV [hydrothermal vent metagenome]|uniref:DNA-directed DNA polymerase n=1 Tax=hydrothermal vent metagenome TaxID=652676 RepID=A0A3B0VDL4_9ZZZZ